MTTNKLLLGAALVGMLACYGCEEEKIPVPVTITDSLIIVDGDTTIRDNPVTDNTVYLKGETVLTSEREEKRIHNELTDDFIVDAINGLRNGTYWDPGDNTFELEFHGDGVGYEYWYDDEITVYGGSGTIDTVAFVSTTEQNEVPGLPFTYEVAHFYKTDGVGTEEIANSIFSETVNYGDYYLVAWIIGAEINQPAGGGFYLTDSIGYALCEGLAQNTGIPHVQTMRFIYSGATDDTNLITISLDSIWYDSDTTKGSMMLFATDTSRDGAANDTCKFIDVLDNYGKLWKRDSIGYEVQAGEQITNKPTISIEKDDPETP